MAYCTVDDLVTRYGEREIIQRTDRERTGEIDTDVAEQAIADAGEEIDGFLQDGGYSVPIDPVPYRIARTACSLARYFLYDDGRPEPVQQEYDKAISFLERVARGTVKLSDEIKDGGSQQPAVSARTQVYGSTFEEQYG